MRIFKIVTPIVFLAAAALADGSARADDLDVIRHTVPAAAIDPSLIIHVGDGKYCSLRPVIGSCEGFDLLNGEGPNKADLPAREGEHIVHEVKTPPAPPAPPSPPSPPTSGGDL